MQRRAFVIVVWWPYEQLTPGGKLTSWCTAGAENHIGIFIPNCSLSEIKAHSIPDVSHETARGSKDVCFDYMISKYPKFHSPNNKTYYTPEARVYLYPILQATASDVHAACLEMAEALPFNNFAYRFNAVFWCWPFHFARSNTPEVGPSTCVALSLRIIARAASGDRTAYTDDAAAFKELNMNSFRCTQPLSPHKLTGHTPRSALKSLQKAQVVGRQIDGFDNAIALCNDRSAAPLGNWLPLLNVMFRE